MSLNEYKIALGFDNAKYLNIYFADWTQEDLVGLAIFPWEHEVHSKLGNTSCYLFLLFMVLSLLSCSIVKCHNHISQNIKQLFLRTDTLKLTFYYLNLMLEMTIVYFSFVACHLVFIFASSQNS